MLLVPTSPHLEQVASSPALFGAVVYGGSLAALTAWEAAAVPWLKRRGILPDVPPLPSMLSEHEKMAAFATPLTAIDYPPLPTLDERQDGRRHLVHTCGRVVQHIYLAQGPSSPLRPEVCEVSDEFSELYGERVIIEKSLVS